jgi:hypothetical protein
MIVRSDGVFVMRIFVAVVQKVVPPVLLAELEGLLEDYFRHWHKGLLHSLLGPPSHLAVVVVVVVVGHLQRSLQSNCYLPMLSLHLVSHHRRQMPHILHRLRMKAPMTQSDLPQAVGMDPAHRLAHH